MSIPLTIAALYFVRVYVIYSYLKIIRIWRYQRMAKDTKDSATLDMFESLYPKSKPGRKPLFGEPMSSAQRSRRYRAEKKRRRED